MNVRSRFEGPAWVTAVATLVSYGLVLLVMFLVLFVAPFLVYTAVIA
ncbi:hypothetical protein [Halosimplex sp. J119]